MSDVPGLHMRLKRIHRGLKAVFTEAADNQTYKLFITEATNELSEIIDELEVLEKTERQKRSMSA